MDVTTQGVGKGRTAEAVRQRSRDIYERLLDRIEERVDSADVFTLSELSQAASVAGRIGLGGEEQRSGDIRIHIVRDQPQLPEQTPPHTLHEVAPAKDIGTHDLSLLASPDTSPSTVAASPHASRDVGDVSVCDATVYDDDA